MYLASRESYLVKEMEFRSQKTINGKCLGGRGSIHRTRFGSNKLDPYLMKQIPRLYSLSPWRERVRVRGINLNSILDTRYYILIKNRRDYAGRFWI
jgi:hypothetical protein